MVGLLAEMKYVFMQAAVLCSDMYRFSGFYSRWRCNKFPSFILPSCILSSLSPFSSEPEPLQFQILKHKLERGLSPMPLQVIVHDTMCLFVFSL